MKCIICGKEFNYKEYNGKIIIYCSRKCYYKYYYNKNKTRILKRQSEWHKEHYTPHPIELKYGTKEEAYKHKLEYAREYYRQHRSYYKQKNREWYQKNKNNLDLKLRHSIAMKKYNRKRKLLKEGGDLDENI